MVNLLEIINELIQELQNYGFFGIFLISFLGSIIPFVPVPYLAIVVLLSQNYDNVGLMLLGLSAGIGGGIAKLTTYFLGRVTHASLPNEKKKELRIFSKLIKKYGVLGVFLFALTPLPDDVLYFPLGLARFDLARFFLANLAGKTILSIGIAFLGKAYFEIVKIYLGEEFNIYAIIIAIIAMIIITIVLLKIKWSKVYEITRKRGIKGLIKDFKKIF